MFITSPMGSTNIIPSPKYCAWTVLETFVKAGNGLLPCFQISMLRLLQVKGLPCDHTALPQLHRGIIMYLYMCFLRDHSLFFQRLSWHTEGAQYLCVNDQIGYTDPKDILHLPWGKDRKTQRFYL